MRRTHATTVYITREQDLALRVLAERTGVPIAQYIREGVDLALAAHAAVDGPQPLAAAPGAEPGPAGVLARVRSARVAAPAARRGR